MPSKTPSPLLYGTLDALILKTLTGGPRHGYAIATFIEEASDETVLIEEGSLYPALYRMERRGWLEAEWGTSELGRRAKLYRLTPAGRAQLAGRIRQVAPVLRRRVEDPAGPMRRLLRSWLWRVPLEQEVDEEIAFHVEMRTRAFIAQGKDPKTARQLAIRHLGDVRRLKRTCVDIGRKRDREMRITQRLEEFGSDVKFALRQMKGSPGFTLVAALTLALGIGANSAMFALADATLLRPLPYPEPDRLVMVWERSPTAGRTPVGARQLA